ncbi:hypothetical protein [Thiobacillus sp.]|uniref:hypothetical protein n=1 Tax=Thiobacillus sp. TaxID=924 RepID=UPI0025FE4843|nr:hypothetical protein [Thiobacillus sp.]
MPRTFIAASTPRMARGLNLRVRVATTRAQIGPERGGRLPALLHNGGQPYFRLVVGRLRQFVEQRFARRAALAFRDDAVQPGRLLFFLPGFVGIAHAGGRRY